MSTMTAATRSTTITRPVTRRKAAGPQAARPGFPARHVVGMRPAACHVGVEAPMWELTERGLMVALALVAGVVGSAVVTCIVAFMSVSALPL